MARTKQTERKVVVKPKRTTTHLRFSEQAEDTSEDSEASSSENEIDSQPAPPNTSGTLPPTPKEDIIREPEGNKLQRKQGLSPKDQASVANVRKEGRMMSDRERRLKRRRIINDQHLRPSTPTPDTESVEDDRKMASKPDNTAPNDADVTDVAGTQDSLETNTSTSAVCNGLNNEFEEDSEHPRKRQKTGNDPDTVPAKTFVRHANNNADNERQATVDNDNPSGSAIGTSESERTTDPQTPDDASGSTRNDPNDPQNLDRSSKDNDNRSCSSGKLSSTADSYEGIDQDPIYDEMGIDSNRNERAKNTSESKRTANPRFPDEPSVSIQTSSSTNHHANNVRESTESHDADGSEEMNKKKKLILGSGSYNSDYGVIVQDIDSDRIGFEPNGTFFGPNFNGSVSKTNVRRLLQMNTMKPQIDKMIQENQQNTEETAAASETETNSGEANNDDNLEELNKPKTTFYEKHQNIVTKMKQEKEDQIQNLQNITENIDIKMPVSCLCLMVDFENTSNAFIQGDVNHHDITDARSQKLVDALCSNGNWGPAKSFQCVASVHLNGNDPQPEQQFVMTKNSEIWKDGGDYVNSKTVGTKYPLIDPDVEVEIRKLKCLFQKMSDNKANILTVKGLKEACEMAETEMAPGEKFEFGTETEYLPSLKEFIHFFQVKMTKIRIHLFDGITRFSAVVENMFKNHTKDNFHHKGNFLHQDIDLQIRYVTQEVTENQSTESLCKLFRKISQEVVSSNMNLEQNTFEDKVSNVMKEGEMNMGREDFNICFAEAYPNDKELGTILKEAFSDIMTKMESNLLGKQDIPGNSNENNPEHDEKISKRFYSLFKNHDNMSLRNVSSSILLSKNKSSRWPWTDVNIYSTLKIILMMLVTDQMETFRKLIAKINKNSSSHCSKDNPPKQRVQFLDDNSGFKDVGVNEHLMTIILSCAVELANVFFPDQTTSSATNTKVKYIATANFVIQIMTELSKKGLNPDLKAMNEDFPATNRVLWNVIEKYVYKQGVGDELHWSMFFHNLPLFKNLATEIVIKYESVMELLLVVYVNFVKKKSNEDEDNTKYKFGNTEKGRKMMESVVEYQIVNKKKIAGFVPEIGILQSGGNTLSFWEKRWDLLPQNEFPSTWSLGYQLSPEQYMKISNIDNETFQKARKNILKDSYRKNFMYQGIISFRANVDEVMKNFKIEDNPNLDGDIITFSDFIQNITSYDENNTTLNYYEEITGTNGLPLYPDKTHKPKTNRKKPVNYKQVDGQMIDDMSYDLEGMVPNSAAIPWKDFVTKGNWNAVEILMNCFHPKNIICDQNGEYVINPETMNLAHMCKLEIVQKLIGKKKKTR